MVNLSFSPDEVNIMLQSFRHCLNTCHDGGMDSGCPDCSKLESVMVKMQAGVGQ